MQSCLSAGADPDLLDYTAPFNHTAVLWAAWGGHAATLQALAELGADFEKRDRGERHALHIAASQALLPPAHDKIKVRRGASLSGACLGPPYLMIRR